MSEKKQTVEQTAKKFLNYSLDPIEYSYEYLTDSEKALCTREEFEELVKWVQEGKGS